jgi:hypothetical protein
MLAAGASRQWRFNEPPVALDNAFLRIRSACEEASDRLCCLRNHRCLRKCDLLSVWHTGGSSGWIIWVDHLGGSWVDLEWILGGSWWILGGSWVDLGGSCGGSWWILGGSWVDLGGSWWILGGSRWILSGSWVDLGGSWWILGGSWWIFILPLLGKFLILITILKSNVFWRRQCLTI